MPCAGQRRQAEAAGNQQSSNGFFLYESLKDPEREKETRINGELFSSAFGDVVKEATGSFLAAGG